MKKLNLKTTLFLLGILLGITGNAFGSGTSLKWSEYSNTPVFSDANFSYCGADQMKILEVHFGCLNCGSSTCPIKRYEYTIDLYKNGVIIDTKVVNDQSGSVTVYWNTFTMGAGVYKAGVSSRIHDFGCITYHTLENNVMSNVITVTALMNPLFSINNTTPTDYTPIPTDATCFRMHASATTCEKDYYIGAAECDLYLNRTYDYEWGVWFTGLAPDNIDIQQLAVTYSYPTYGYVGSASRQGTALKTGNLAAAFGGGARYYRLSLCVSPIWTCKTALIRVLPNLCRPEPGTEDTNEYIVTAGPEGEMPKDQIVTSLKEAFEKSEQLLVFPNPGNGIFTVTLASTNEALLEIFDIKGSKIVSTTFDSGSYNVDLTNYPKGMYMVNITAGDNHYTKKIVKE